MEMKSPEMDIPTASELRAEVRQLLNNRSENFNVLVIGLAGSGISTLINSMNMALAEQWSELAPFGQGFTCTWNPTLRLDKVPMFEDQFMKEKVENYEKKVYFWDCAGMNNFFDEAYGEFIGLTLDGRVPDKTITLVRKGDNQMVSVKDLREKFPTVTEGNRFNRVLFLCACDEAAPENLLELVRKTAAPVENEGRRIPVFLALSKKDKAKNVYNETKKTARNILNLWGNEERTAELTLYHAAIEGRDEGCAIDARKKFLPNEDIDRDLLIFLLSLLDPAHDRALKYSVPYQESKKTSCALS